MGTPPNVSYGPSSRRESRARTVFGGFRRFLAVTEKIEDALSSLNNTLDKLCQAQQEQGPATERLDALELSRSQWEAECEGLLQKAEGKLRAANNAEARERANKKSYAHLIDPLAEVGDEPETPAPDPHSNDDGSPSEEDRLLALRMALASTPREIAKRAKWGMR